MSTFDTNNSSRQHLETRLIHDEPVDSQPFKSLHVAEHRGSSTFFENTASLTQAINPLGFDYSYGLHGNPTQFTLAKRLALIEQAKHCLIVPSGLNAISLVAYALLDSQDHWLIPNNVYRPVMSLAEQLKQQHQIDYSVYDPLLPELLSQYVQDNTRLLWLEAPGSVTLETPNVQTVIASVRKRNPNVIAAIDNTYSAGLGFKPFNHGCDLSIQALTKHQCGHADVLLGAILAKNTQVFKPIEHQKRVWGIGVSPTDCNLVLRGLQTMSLRYQHQAKTALEVAQWLEQQQQVVHSVLHPALPNTPGHPHFKQQFTQSGCLFSVVFKQTVSTQQAHAFVDALTLFRIAYSWGGPESLALPFELSANRKKQLQLHLSQQTQQLTTQPERPKHSQSTHDLLGPVVRFAIGLENRDDLIADLTQALETIFS